MPEPPVISVYDLHTAIPAREGVVRAVRGVSFELGAGETLGLVGESGSGKSITALSIMRLLPAGAKVTHGEVRVAGQEVLTLSPSALRGLRGGTIAMVFQDSLASLNPLLTIGRQITEGLEVHKRMRSGAATLRARELLEEVGVTDPVRRLKQFPHQLSGGLRQRVAIAVALAADPAVLIADEPTTALDVTVQAQLLELLRREQQERGMALILITHDLGVVAGTADRVAVMYAGRIVEEASTEQLFARPRHPYTLGLLASVPTIAGPVGDRLASIPGSPPSMWSLPDGCPFRSRCDYAFDECAVVEPALEAVEPDHASACYAAKTLVVR
jgi:oligopeptide/dipeptide ABC transporter ATP-binding protein